MKTKEELNSLKEEVETMSKKLHELTDEELEQVVGGVPRGKIRATVGKGDFIAMAIAEGIVLQDKDSGVK